MAIQLLAKRCRFLMYFIAILAIFAVIFLWLSSPAFIHSTWLMIIGANNYGITVDGKIRVLGFMISLLPLSVLLYISTLLIQLFKNYEQTAFFTLGNAKLIRKLGFSLYLWAASNIIFKTLLSLVLTMNNPPHAKLLSINITGMDIQSIVIGSIVILLSWVMIEAQKIAEDNALMP